MVFQRHFYWNSIYICYLYCVGVWNRRGRGSPPQKRPGQGGNVPVFFVWCFVLPFRFYLEDKGFSVWISYPKASRRKTFFPFFLDLAHCTRTIHTAITMQHPLSSYLLYLQFENSSCFTKPWWSLMSRARIWVDSLETDWLVYVWDHSFVFRILCFCDTNTRARSEEPKWSP